MWLTVQRWQEFKKMAHGAGVARIKKSGAHPKLAELKHVLFCSKTTFWDFKSKSALQNAKKNTKLPGSDDLISEWWKNSSCTDTPAAGHDTLVLLQEFFIKGSCHEID